MILNIGAFRACDLLGELRYFKVVYVLRRGTHHSHMLCGMLGEIRYFPVANVLYHAMDIFNMP